MSALSSKSTDEQVFAAYDDAAGYEEDHDPQKALAFITACRILRRRLPLSAGKDGRSMTRETLDAEITAARNWLDANPSQLGTANPNRRIRYLTTPNFRG